MKQKHLNMTGFCPVGFAAAVMCMTAGIASADTGGKMLSGKVMGESCATYTVQAGDTLGSIAETVTGNRADANTIFRMNGHLIKDIDQLSVGQSLYVPCEKAKMSDEKQKDPVQVAIPGVWTARSGDYLVPVLVNWGERAGYDVIVEQKSDWRFVVPYSSNGDFRGAVDEVLTGFLTSAHSPVVVFYSNDVMTIGVR